jgi:hypothetical protein
MAAIFIDELGMKAPDINLGVGPGTHGSQTAKILAANRISAIIDDYFNNIL